MMKPFRGCRYEVRVYTPNKGLWSRHSSLKSAQRAFREAVNNDVDGGAIQILGREVVRS